MSRSIILIFFFLAGCTTALWAPDHYTARIDGFYINKENGSLLVSGQDEGYIFLIDSSLRKTLLLKNDVLFSPIFSNFKVDKNNIITGQITLKALNYKLGKDKKFTLSKLGFEGEKGSKILKRTWRLKGKRYEIVGKLPFTKLDRIYSIGIEKPTTFSETIGKIIATPVAVTIDAVVTVPATFLLVTIMATDSL